MQQWQNGLANMHLTYCIILFLCLFSCCICLAFRMCVVLFCGYSILCRVLLFVFSLYILLNHYFMFLFVFYWISASYRPCEQRQQEPMAEYDPHTWCLKPLARSRVRYRPPSTILCCGCGTKSWCGLLVKPMISIIQWYWLVTPNTEYCSND